MSDNEDAESKTEEATEKKISDTLEQGKTPLSRDVVTAFGVFAFLGCLAFLTEAGARTFFETMGLLLSNSGALTLRSDADAYRFLEFMGLETGALLTPFLLLLMGAGIVGGFAQGAPRLVVDRIMPDFSRISPLSGWSRLAGLPAVIELGKAVAKMLIVGGAVAIVIAGDRAAYTDAMRMEPRILPTLTRQLVMHLTSVVAISLAVLGTVDFLWTKFKWRKDLRMSRQEVKDEMKQAEGDPLVKARLRSLAMDRSRRRMMASVPKASFVIANPTHYAIALRYVREEGGAPMVLAKGKDLVALKIREVAERSGVPVLERKELARAMFEIVEVDKMIPQEFYRPVAELIHFLDAAARQRRH